MEKWSSSSYSGSWWSMWINDLQNNLLKFIKYWYCIDIACIINFQIRELIFKIRYKTIHINRSVFSGGRNNWLFGDHIVISFKTISYTTIMNDIPSFPGNKQVIKNMTINMGGFRNMLTQIKIMNLNCIYFHKLIVTPGAIETLVSWSNRYKNDHIARQLFCINLSLFSSSL